MKSLSAWESRTWFAPGVQKLREARLFQGVGDRSFEQWVQNWRRLGFPEELGSLVIP